MGLNLIKKHFTSLCDFCEYCNMFSKDLVTENDATQKTRQHLMTLGRLDSIDALRLFASFLIVVLHWTTDNILGQGLHLLAKNAVPVFFIISGFFVPLLCIKGKIRKQQRKILNLTLMSLLLYLIIYFMQSPSGLLISLRKVFDYKNLIVLLITNRTSHFEGGHLWFLLALLYDLVLLGEFYKRRYCKYVWVLMFMLFFANFMIANYVDASVCYIYRNFLFTGFPYMCVGGVIFFYRETLSRIVHANVVLPILLIISFAMLLAEIWIYGVFGLPIHREHYVSIIFSSIIIVLWVINNPAFMAGTFIPEWGRKYAVYVYVFHWLFRRLLYSVLPNSVHLSLILPITAFLLSLVMSMLYVYVVDKVCSFIRKRSSTPMSIPIQRML